MTTRIKLRRDTATNWGNTNPVLALGEAGYDTTNNQLRVGDGTTVWGDLSPIGGSIGVGLDGQINIGEETTTNGGSNSIAIGTAAGIGQAWSTVALGNNAGNSDQSPSAIAIGRSAGYSNQNWDAIAIGRRAGQTDQQEGTIALGYYAGQNNQRYHSIAIGSQAGQTNQYWDAIAIGKGAGNNDQDHQTIAIGHRAGEIHQSAQSVAIGKYAGNYYQGQHAVAIGANAGNDSQGVTAIAIGEDAGNNSQGFRAIAIGRLAGNDYQGNQSISVGALAGYGGQGEYGIAVGRHAGESDQGQNAIAIGNQAGRGVSPGTVESFPTANWVSGGDSGETTFIVDSTNGIYPGMSPNGSNFNDCVVTAVNRGTNEITISVGTAGQIGGSIAFFGQQGQNAIAIGALAGASVQHPYSIIINATPAELLSPSAGSFVVKPVNTGTTGNQLYYNNDSGEVTYGGINRYTSTANGTTTDAPVIDVTSSKVFLSPASGINASYFLGDGLYDGQTIEFFPQWADSTTNQDGIDIQVFVGKIYNASAPNGQYASGAVMPWYVFSQFYNNGTAPRATWNAEQQNWVLTPNNYD